MATYAVCYGRVSTIDQAANGHSLDAQRSKAEAYCAAFSLEPTTWLADEGVSGGIAPDERPALREALRMLAAGEAQALVVASLSRLGRRTRDVLEIADRAEAEGWRLVVLDLQLDTSTPTGRLALTVLSAVAELEREQTRERTREGLAAARAKGVVLGPPVSANTLAAGARAEQLRAEGLTWAAVVDVLDDERMPTARGKAGAGAWSRRQAHRAARLHREHEERAQGA